MSSVVYLERRSRFQVDNDRLYVTSLDSKIDI